jgi:putative transposase
MKVSTSGYYSWANGNVSDQEKANSSLRDQVAEVFDQSKGSYGRRRITAAINKDEDNKVVSINRVGRRMKELGIAGYTPPSYKKTTIPDPLLKDSPDLVKAALVKGIDQIWVSDITYIATKEGWLYLCVIMDLHSRKVVGWSTRYDMKAEIVIEAFKAATKNRKPEGDIIFHSDKGGQYKSKKFRRTLKRRGFKQSMTGKDHCFDNAHAESFFGSLKRDIIRGAIFATRDIAEDALFEYVEVFYNNFRLHSSLGNRSPEEFEKGIA